MKISWPTTITMTEFWLAWVIVVLLMLFFSWGFELGKTKAISENEKQKSEHRSGGFLERNYIHSIWEVEEAGNGPEL
ncbi:MAG: hypothetical protein COB54_06665 [Alphaproteobacteria bacterium]|nr:MAG: hypothetical protein COB54_06665 [Alphaproteobacteria bacterium]